MTKFKRIIVNISEEQYQNIETIMHKRGLFNVSETIRYMISEISNRELNNYREIAKARMKAKANPESKEAVALMKVEKLRNKCLDIVKRIGGTTAVDPVDNFEYVQYSVYEEIPGGMIQRYEIKERLDNMNEQTVLYQYKNLLGLHGVEVEEYIKSMLTN